MQHFTPQGLGNVSYSTGRIAPLVRGITLSYPKDPKKIQYGMRLERATNFFPPARRIHHLSKEMYRDKSLALEAELEHDPDLVHLRSLARFSVYIPKIKVGNHYRAILKQFLLPPLQTIYTNMFLSSDRLFKNELDVSANWSAAPNSRHQKVLDRIVEEPIVALYFPAYPLRGFPIEAALQQTEVLPSYFALAGLLETVMLFMLYPDFVSCDTGLKIMASGVHLSSDPESTVCFEPQAKYLIVRPTKPELFNNGCDMHSSGLLYLGKKFS